MDEKKIVFCGILVGVYLNVLIVLPFLRLQYLLWVSALTIYSVIAFPLLAYLWDSAKLALTIKIRQFLVGLGLISIIFSMIYGIAFFVGILNPLFG